MSWLPAHLSCHSISYMSRGLSRTVTRARVKRPTDRLLPRGQICGGPIQSLVCHASESAKRQSRGAGAATRCGPGSSPPQPAALLRRGPSGSRPAWRGTRHGGRIRLRRCPETERKINRARHLCAAAVRRLAAAARAGGPGRAAAAGEIGSGQPGLPVELWAGDGGGAR